MQIDLKENEKLGNPTGVEVSFLKSCIFITFVFSFGKIQRQKHDLFEKLAVTNDCNEFYEMRKTCKNTNTNYNWAAILFYKLYMYYFE